MLTAPSTASGSSSWKVIDPSWGRKGRVVVRVAKRIIMTLSRRREEGELMTGAAVAGCAVVADYRYEVDMRRRRIRARIKTCCQ